ncbi:MAG: hypothetical protein HDQ96_15525 [Lachnospiraceae bacterium]|nr:hypothetical protein [Lachnospiraceae bacterium]
MYKRYLSLCIMLLLCTQIAGCGYSDSKEEAVSNVQPEAEEPVEELAEEGLVESGSQKVYTPYLQDIFAVPIRYLSSNIYFYEDKLYLDVWERHDGDVNGKPVEGNVRMVFAEEGEEIVLLDLTELSPTWDRKTVGTTHYLVSGDQLRQVLWIYDLKKGNVEELRVGENQEIWSWDAKNGKIFYGVRTQNTEEDILNEIMIRDLDSKKEETVTFDRRVERIQELSVNDKEEIGVYYCDIDSYEEHLGIIQDGQFTEIDTSNVEIWNLGRNQLYEFQLMDNKIMICMEDIGHILTPWNRSWELFFDGSWKDIPCETYEEGVLGYVDDFYYVEDYYLIYGRPWRRSDDVESAKVRLYTMEGEYRCEIEIPD